MIKLIFTMILKFDNFPCSGGTNDSRFDNFPSSGGTNDSRFDNFPSTGGTT